MRYIIIQTEGYRKQETEDVLLGDLLNEGKRVCIHKPKVITQWFGTECTIQNASKCYQIFFLFLWLAGFTVAQNKFLRPVISSPFWLMHINIMRGLMMSQCMQSALQI